ncbi:hypothetical protein JCM6882_009766 [Rhodosporidiobolus microsporus]
MSVFWTHTKHHEPEPVHSKTGLYEKHDKKGGAGHANWGADKDLIREGLEEVRTGKVPGAEDNIAEEMKADKPTERSSSA